MSNCKAKALSIVDIRKIASIVRRILQIPNEEAVDVIKCLDVLTLKFSKHNFNYIILSDNDEIFSKNEEAKTDLISGTIFIKESVYYEACTKKCCRANFTIAHEIGHFVLHHMLNLMNFARSTNETKAKIYEDPEWQANSFACEFLMPYDQCYYLTPKEIRRRYRVTYAAASIRYERIY